MSEVETPATEPADERAGALLRQRQLALCNYLDASADIATTRIRANLTGWHRWLQHLPGSPVARATARRDALTRELAVHGVGADDHRWGVLSGAYVRGLGAALCLEDTLSDLILRYGSEAAHWTGRLRALVRATVAARPQAAVGDRAVVAKLTEELLEVTRAAPDEAARQRLCDHLPGVLRPVPCDIEALRRADALVEVVFDVYADTVKLDNITVNPELRGTGLGTAVLQHLCRAADAHHLYIVGQLVPTFRDDDSAVPLLADWCRRHGFSVNERLGGRIARTPVSVPDPAAR
ncbi:GNAT family N-acetyltransferase [Nocardia yunnanensis]|uniref:GNAT family N-acetyltransferase n=1 Tax=Nocardia yunnanensis TaxID=2382165 RepID=A0A386ZLZ2_9NOCA|nr:GNAT family N-acetyltransferase [Nocardia yunnanensis]AYF77669.1 GNAT family N-acetyltransferase [Nocardia yunnanensis]